MLYQAEPHPENNTAAVVGGLVAACISDNASEGNPLRKTFFRRAEYAASGTEKMDCGNGKANIVFLPECVATTELVAFFLKIAFFLLKLVNQKRIIY